MKKLFVIAIVSLSLLLLVANRIAAQEAEAPKLTLDQQIKAAKEENAKLKKLKAILDENKRIKAELGIDEGVSVTADEVGPPATAENFIATEKLIDSADSLTGSGSNTVVSVPTENSNSAERPATSANSIFGSGSSTIVPAFVDVTPPDNIIQPDTKTQGDSSGSALSSPAPKPATPTTVETKPDVNTPQVNACDNRIGHEKNLCLLANDLVNRVNGDAARIQYRPAQSFALFAAALGDLVVEKEITKEPTLDTQAARTDKQIGADAQGSGTTSLVAKGGIPLIMSLATENGSAVSSVNGTTMSFRFNPLGLLEYLSNGDTENFDTTANVSNLLRRTSFGLSYDISQGVDTPTFTGRRDQFSGLSFRYELISERSPTSERVRKYTQEFVREAGGAFASAALPDLVAIFSLNDDSKMAPEIKAFIDGLQNAIDANRAELTAAPTMEAKKSLVFQILKNQFGEAPVEEMKKNESVFKALKRFGATLDSYQEAENDLQKKLTQGTLFTFDYNFNRSFTASDTSDFRLIYEKGWKNGIDFTLNGSLAAFHDPSPSVPITNAMAQQMEDQSRIRDFGFATQLDVPINGIPGGFSDSNLSLAFKYQRMNTDSITLFDGTTISGLKGDIYVGQAKVLVPIGNSGLFFPLSFTYANRKELIKEKKSRGSFGFTFDLSSLLEKSFNPFR